MRSTLAKVLPLVDAFAGLVDFVGCAECLEYVACADFGAAATVELLGLLFGLYALGFCGLLPLAFWVEVMRLPLTAVTSFNGLLLLCCRCRLKRFLRYFFSRSA